MLANSYPDGIKRASYLHVLESAETFDLVLFCGGALVSKVIEGVSGSPVSHVGMIFRDKDDNAPLWLYESDKGSKLTDIITGVVKSGPQFVPLYQKVLGYDGPYFVLRRLHGARSVLSSHAIRGKLKEIFERAAYKPYETNYIELFLSAFKMNKRTDEHAFFCTELVAHVWHEMGFLRGLDNTNNYTLQDMLSAQLDFVDGIRLGPPRYIRIDSAKEHILKSISSKD